MTTMKCRCGFDSGYTHIGSSYNVGEVMKKSGLTWVMLQDGGAVWICSECTKKVNKAALEITAILGSDYWVAISVMPRSSEGAKING